MAKRVVAVEIDCGNIRCYSEPGRPCPYVTQERFGSVWTCSLFPPDDLSQTVGQAHIVGTILEDDRGDGTGWLLRCDACVEAESRAAAMLGESK